jgi:ribosomal protein S7
LEAVFASQWLSKFISVLFKKGKKFIVESILYQVFGIIKEVLNVSSLFFFFEALEKIKPYVGLKIHKGGIKKKKNLKVFPCVVSSYYQYKKAIGWLAAAVKVRNESNTSIKLYKELNNIYFSSTGEALKKKREHYKYVLLFKSTKNFK